MRMAKERLKVLILEFIIFQEVRIIIKQQMWLSGLKPLVTQKTQAIERLKDNLLPLPK